MNCNRFVIAILFTCLAVAPGAAYVDDSRPRTASSRGPNVTGEYISVFKSIKPGFSSAQLKKLSAYRILFVPGFLSNALQYSPAADKSALGLIPTFFAEQIRWLKAQGLDAAVVPIESEAGITYNAGIIARAVKKSKKPVILICHSKGGLDTLEGLLRYPSMRTKVRGLIFIQSPFYGSPIADEVLKASVLAVPAGAALKAMGGSVKSLKNLAVKSRVAYQDKNAAAILKLTAAIPAISFGSYKNREKFKLDTVFKLFRDFMADAGMKNDGLVPVTSAMLPGSNKIAVQGPDHFATVIPVAYPPFNRLRFIQTMLTMLLARGL